MPVPATTTSGGAGLAGRRVRPPPPPAEERLRGRAGGTARRGAPGYRNQRGTSAVPAQYQRGITAGRPHSRPGRQRPRTAAPACLARRIPPLLCPPALAGTLRRDQRCCCCWPARPHRGYFGSPGGSGASIPWTPRVGPGPPLGRERRSSAGIGGQVRRGRRRRWRERGGGEKEKGLIGAPGPLLAGAVRTLPR